MSPLLLSSNLRLLDGQLQGLAETSYFSQDLNDLIQLLRLALERLLAKLESTPPAINLDIARAIADDVWELTQFLTGSTTKLIPYEVVFSIQRAALPWTPKKLLITTALTQAPNFFFKTSQQVFFDLLNHELNIDIQTQPVQIALPYIYRHKPLFCLPLFHELGHYVDMLHDVVNTSLLLSPDHIGPDLPDMPTSNDIGKMTGHQRQILMHAVRAHRHEYFADLFFAAYVGGAAIGFLEQFCPTNSVTPTHPSTASRVAAIEDFLNGRANPMHDLFQNVLQRRGLALLTKRFVPTSVSSAYICTRPNTPTSDEQLFGLFQDSWFFLQDMWRAPTGPYEKLQPSERERIINDLTEKSIRSHMITEEWNEAAKSI